MSDTGPPVDVAAVNQVLARPLSPATAVVSDIHGLSVTRRRRPDLDPKLPSVILVHGAMDRSASFGRVMRRLPSLDVIAYDRRGYGNSPGSETCRTLADHAEDLRQLILWSDAAQVVIIGHSLGGTIAMDLAAKHVPQIVGLGVYESPTPWLDNSFATVGGGAVEKAEANGDEAGAEFFYRMMVGDDTWNRIRERDRLARRAEGPTLIRELVSLRNPDEAVALREVTVPVIVGRGGKSRRETAETAVRLRESLPDAWMVSIDTAGHGAHLTNPDDFAAFVRACVARVDYE